MSLAMSPELSPRFAYTRRVAFGDTDAMGVAHHAAYLHFVEEARVAWMRARELSDTHYPHSEHVLAVLGSRVKHLKPARFEDLLRVEVQARRIGLKIHFQYAIDLDGTRIAEAETWHIPVNANLKPVRPNKRLLKQLEKEPWIEIWLSNS